MMSPGFIDLHLHAPQVFQGYKSLLAMKLDQQGLRKKQKILGYTTPGHKEKATSARTS